MIWKIIKWSSVVCNVIGSIIVAGNLGITWIGFLFYMMGCLGLGIVSVRDKDWAWGALACVWLVVDITGLIRWI